MKLCSYLTKSSDDEYVVGAVTWYKVISQKGIECWISGKIVEVIN